MSIATAITNLQGKIANAYAAIEEKGGTLPATQNAANLATAIEDIPSGGEGQPVWGINALSDVCYTGSNGLTKMMGGVTGNLRFRGVTNIDNHGMAWVFTRAPINSVTFPDLSTLIYSNCLEGAFLGSSVKSVSFPEFRGVNTNTSAPKEQFKEAFKDCASLTAVSFPKLESGGNIYGIGLEGVFKNAFQNCTSLSSVSFPELSGINSSSTAGAGGAMEGIFAGCSSLKSVSLPKLELTSGKRSLTSAFQNCSSLTDISFPQLVEVGPYSFDSAFMGCTNLKSVSFPKLKILIAGGINQGHQFNEAFMGCVNLKSVSFPELSDTTNYAFQKAFEGCTSLTAVSFPKLTGVTSLYAGMPRAFYGCTALPSVSFPVLSAVINQTAMMNAFTGCTSLTSVSFPNLVKADGVTVMKECFKNCTSLTNVSFPELSNINNHYSFEGIFNGCTSLTAVSFPKLAQTSGSKPFGDAFVGTQVTTLSFPELSAIRSIGTNASYATFYRNTTITRINFPKLTIIARGNNDAVDGMYLFTNCTNLAEIHFAAENQSIIESASGYATKWNGPSGCQIYFDL